MKQNKPATFIYSTSNFYWIHVISYINILFPTCTDILHSLVICIDYSSACTNLYTYLWCKWLQHPTENNPPPWLIKGPWWFLTLRESGWMGAGVLGWNPASPELDMSNGVLRNEIYTHTNGSWESLLRNTRKYTVCRHSIYTVGCSGWGGSFFFEKFDIRGHQSPEDLAHPQLNYHYGKVEMGSQLLV